MAQVASFHTSRDRHPDSRAECRESEQECHNCHNLFSLLACLSLPAPALPKKDAAESGRSPVGSPAPSPPAGSVPPPFGSGPRLRARSSSESFRALFGSWILPSFCPFWPGQPGLWQRRRAPRSPSARWPQTRPRESLGLWVSMRVKVEGLSARKFQSPRLEHTIVSSIP